MANETDWFGASLKSYWIVLVHSGLCAVFQYRPS